MADFQDTIEQEIWKEIPGYPGYEVSNFGRVRSYWHRNYRQHLPHLIKPCITRAKGTKYYVVSLGWGKQFKIHRLVLLAFIGICPPKHEACHNDGNSFNNHIDNLRWDTRRNNMLDRAKHGDIKFMGEHHSKAKLSTVNVVDIRSGVYSHFSTAHTAKIFGVCPRTIRDVIQRKSWKHIP